jgi:hypothetical protein
MSMVRRQALNVVAMLAAPLIAALMAAACGTAPRPTADLSRPLPPALQLLLDSTSMQDDIGVDTFEVWICDVPLDTTDPTYQPASFRLQLTPTDVAATLEQHVPAYFARLSLGLYRPRFVAGSTYTMSARDSPNVCVDHAIAGSSASSNGVLAIATAEHTAVAAGGFGIAGTRCATPSPGRCSAMSTGRAAYLGASDFHPAWGPQPALDLVEHEIGHLLGWPHSGDDHGEGHSSGLDVMSDSAAPRQFDAGRRDAQDTLAVNRLAARWLPISSVVVADLPETAVVGDRTGPTGRFRLSPSFSSAGPRAVVLPLDRTRLLFVEYLAKAGLDALLPRGGVTVTLVDQSPEACAHTDDQPCTGANRLQLTRVGRPPFYDMLTAPGDSTTILGWTVTLQSIGDEVTFQVARTPTAG